ncbi:MAG: helix-turn-helix domain-containing protein [Candidatus Dormibacteraceae bacterium]
MSPTTTLSERPVAPQLDESEALHDVDRLRSAPPARPSGGAGPARLIAPDGQEHALPPSLYEVLLRAAHQLAAGRAVSIVPVGTKLSTQQAADLLGVSRPHVVKLLEAGEIPYTKAGKHRRVLLGDVLDYREAQAVRRRHALEELASVSEDLPLV